MPGLDLMRRQRAMRRQGGYMTQRFSFHEDLSIQQNLAFVAGHYRLPRRAVVGALADLGLTSRRHQLAGALPGGWKQRRALAACVMHRPRLLPDEPTASVDPKACRVFRGEIHARAEGGTTVPVTTHHMDEAERCHRIHFIACGRLITSGTVEQAIARSGLITRIVTTDRPGASGMAQVEPFGTPLHVTGTDAGALDAAIAAVGATGASADSTAWKMPSSAWWSRPGTTCGDTFACPRPDAAAQGVHPDAP